MCAEFGAEARIALLFPWSQLRERITVQATQAASSCALSWPKGRLPLFSAKYWRKFSRAFHRAAAIRSSD